MVHLEIHDEQFYSSAVFYSLFIASGWELITFTTRLLSFARDTPKTSLSESLIDGMLLPKVLLTVKHVFILTTV